MTRTFLVEIEIGTELVADVAAELEEIVARSFDVISVKPWASPGTTLPPEPTTQQNQQTQTNA